MGSPCEPLTARQEWIAELEGLGYDLMPGVPSSWRASKTDQQLRDALKVLNSGEGDDKACAPDISDLVEAIREAVDAAVEFDAAHPDLEFPDSKVGKRWQAAFDRLRDLLSDCDKAMEAFGK